MMKDERYSFAKPLIESGSITQLKDLLKLVPKTKIAADLGKNVGRINDVLENAEELTWLEIYTLAQLIGVPKLVIDNLIEKQYLQKKTKSIKAGSK